MAARVVPGRPAHLAVGDDVEARFLLQGDRLVYGAVFCGAQLIWRDRAGVCRKPRRKEVLRLQQAPDCFGAELLRAWSHPSRPLGLTPGRLIRGADRTTL